MKRVYWITIVLLSATLGLAGCGKSSSPSYHASPHPVAVMAAAGLGGMGGGHGGD